jgi:hypothetical protein
LTFSGDKVNLKGVGNYFFFKYIVTTPISANCHQSKQSNNWKMEQLFVEEGQSRDGFWQRTANRKQLSDVPQNGTLNNKAQYILNCYE